MQATTTTRPKPRRLLRQTSFAAAFATLAFAGMASGEAGAAIRGLVIGIDQYPNLGAKAQLAGAVNDARDIAQALAKAGAQDVVLLVDGEATKVKIAETWKALVTRAEPGDTLIFSYAGHGSQEPEPAGRNGEPDGLNENFILGGFSPRGIQAAERIVDDEVFDWLKMADDKGVKAILIADSCHSGTMYRSVSEDNGLRYRNLTIPQITDDQLLLPPPASARATPDDFRTVTFVGATEEGRTIPEVRIEGQMRGALSYSFARAVEGGADRNGDGQITQEELVSFLVPSVFQLVQGQQAPQVLPLRATGEPLVAAAEKTDQPKVVEKSADALLVHVTGGDGSALSGLTDVILTDTAAAADLVWDMATGNVEHVVGGRVAENADAKAIIPIIAKWATLKWLGNHASGAPGKFILHSGNQRYKPGEHIELSFDGAERPYMTLFNLAPDGRVEFFVEPEEVNIDWRNRKSDWKLTPKEPPFGAEHLVAVLTDEPLPSFHAALQSMSSAERAVGLRGIVEAVLGGRQFQLGLASIYTGTGG